jgi:hypothetical protein
MAQNVAQPIFVEINAYVGKLNRRKQQPKNVCQSSNFQVTAQSKQSPNGRILVTLAFGLPLNLLISYNYCHN